MNRDQGPEFEDQVLPPIDTLRLVPDETEAAQSLRRRQIYEQMLPFSPDCPGSFSKAYLDKWKKITHIRNIPVSLGGNSIDNTLGVIDSYDLDPEAKTVRVRFRGCCTILNGQFRELGNQEATFPLEEEPVDANGDIRDPERWYDLILDPEKKRLVDIFIFTDNSEERLQSLTLTPQEQKAVLILYQKFRGRDWQRKEDPIITNPKQWLRKLEHRHQDNYRQIEAYIYEIGECRRAEKMLKRRVVPPKPPTLYPRLTQQEQIAFNKLVQERLEEVDK